MYRHIDTYELILSHVHVTDCNAQAQNLLKLELDGGTELISLDGKVIVVGDGGRELANLVETGTEKTGDLLDESLRGNESIVLLGELLDELLVLVELLQILNRLELHTGSLGLVAVESITENADGHLGTGNMGKPVVNCVNCIDLATQAILTFSETHLMVPEKRLSRWGS